MKALHFMRYMEAQGYQPQRLTLKHAWPPMRSKGAISVAIEQLEETLASQRDAELKSLQDTWEIPKDGIRCLVFSQGTASAQRGDVFALLFDIENKMGEHYKTKPSSLEVCCNWWSSLGVSLSSEGRYNLSPSTESAGYSYRGLQMFCKLLGDWLSFPVQLGKRTLALSFRAHNDFPVPDNENCRVWFREMLEPTISVLEPNPELAMVE